MGEEAVVFLRSTKHESAFWLLRKLPHCREEVVVPLYKLPI